MQLWYNVIASLCKEYRRYAFSHPLTLGLDVRETTRPHVKHDEKSARQKMKARHVLDALDRVALFRSQAGKKAHRGRVEEIGDDLDSALSLLDLRQSRQQFRDDFFKTGGEIRCR